MKKSSLLTSTALVSAALAMGVTGAQAATMKLGGYAEFWLGYADNDDDAGNVNNFDVKQDAEIYFLVEEKLDNGIVAGLRFEMEAGNGNDNGSGPAPAGTATDGFDESFAYVKTNFGQINIGNNDVAAAYVNTVSTVGPVGNYKSDAGDWLRGISSPNNADNDLGIGDSQNITYFTPRVAGFQAIVSYNPDNSDFTDSDFDNQATSGFHHGVSGALKFDRKFGNVGVGVGASYTELEAPDVPGGPSTAHGYSVGGRVDFSGFRISAKYGHENLTSRTDEWLAAAVRYRINKMHTVSVGWSRGERKDPDTLENTWYTAGWEGQLGKGVSLQASLFAAETDFTSPASTDIDGWGAVGGIEFRY